jgi:hypothetical protein
MITSIWCRPVGDRRDGEAEGWQLAVGGAGSEITVATMF